MTTKQNLLQPPKNLPKVAKARRRARRKSKKSKSKKEKKQKDVESLIPKEEQDYLDSSQERPNKPSATSIFDMDMLGESLPNQNQSPSTSSNQPKNLLDDLDFLNTTVSTPQSDPKEVVLTADKGQGMQISGTFVRKEGRPCLDLTFTNRSSAPISGLAIKFNVNSFGVGPSQPQIQMILPGQSADALLPLATHPSMLAPNAPSSPVLQIALKNSAGIFYFQMNMPIHVLFQENGQLSRDEYLGMWKANPEEHTKDIPNVAMDSMLIQSKFQQKKYVLYSKKKCRNTGFLIFLY